VATCAVADEALAIWFLETPKKSIKIIALQLPKQDLYSFKLCTPRTVDKVHALLSKYYTLTSLQEAKTATAQSVTLNLLLITNLATVFII